jgi:hypothetical protein
LQELSRTRARGTPEEVLEVTAEVRAAAGAAIDQELALVLAQAEAAARSGRQP